MTSHMLAEIQEIPSIVERQLKSNEEAWKQLSNKIKKDPINFIMTIARGSSDHAATFGKYLFENYLGLPTVSSAPSIQTLYHSKLKLRNSLSIALSQSGKSPDICEVLGDARQNGSLTLAVVNNVESPLAGMSELIIPVQAGVETSVAATKSYIGTLTALAQGTAILSENKGLLDALDHLPEYLHQALSMNWQLLTARLKNEDDILTIGRGFGYPIAQEAALKFKETCRLHAEAFSSAEVLHGPLALVRKDYPVLQFIQNDQTIPSNLELSQKMIELGSQVFVAAPKGCVRLPKECNPLPLPKSLHGTLDPIIMATAFYLMVEKLAISRNLNPDQPANLKKVTETL